MIDRAEVLGHPNRRALHGHVVSAPGINFRSLVRASGLATGTAAHHLSVLVRHRFIVRVRHGSTLRHYENGAGLESSWKQLALLREAPLRQLHDWLEANPGSCQRDTLNALAIQGWSRSSTQHRLNRLARNGLVTVRAQGRSLRYWTTPRSAWTTQGNLTPRPASEQTPSLAPASSSNLR